MHHKNHFASQLFYGLVIFFFLYPVLTYTVMYDFGIFKEKLPHGGFWEIIQVFFSGPALLLAGFILLLKAKSIVVRISGIILIMLSIYWLYRIIIEVINES